MSDILAVVPVKGLSDAKSRLAGVLSADSRKRLALAMLEDVTDALLLSGSVMKLVIVSRDEALDRLACRKGAVLFRESCSGLNEALEEACQYLVREYPSRPTMIVPGDVPLLTSDTVDELVFALGDRASPTVVAARSRDGGTNALLRSPASVIPLSFGRGSFEIHRQSTQARGASFVQYQSNELALDIDAVEDLEALVESGSATRAAKLAKHLLISESRLRMDL